MIKRRFFKQDHGDKSAANSSSSSDSSPEPSQEEVDGDDHPIDRAENEEVDKPPSPSPGSGYETEDGSANDSEGDSSGVLSNDKEESPARSGNLKDNHLVTDVHAMEKDGKLLKVGDKPCDPNDPIQAELANCILKLKSVFKCRLCPRIILLNENTVRTHLNSKRHARSKKLLGEGRLKLMLNSDGEIEEEQETHSERHARTLALAQELDAQPRKDEAHQRKRQRRKKDNGSRHPPGKKGKKRGRNCD